MKRNPVLITTLIVALVLIFLIPNFVMADTLIVSGTHQTGDWYLYQSGELKITGTGAISYPYAPPWSGYYDQIKSVVIDEGITSIPREAFSYLSISSASLPSTLITIGSHAFYGCNQITTITIPKNVTTISDNAFSDCSRLKSITISPSVTTIGANAFAYCNSLTVYVYENSIAESYAKNNNLSYTIIHIHSLTKTQEKAATCTESGCRAYWTCTNCGKRFSDAEGENEINLENLRIAALGHNVETWTITTPASCTENGMKTGICSRCSLTVTEEIPATSHVFEHCDARHATCTMAGNSEYWFCNQCHKCFSDQNGDQEITSDSYVINALGHNLTAHPTVEASCTKPGNIAYWSCDRCGKHFSDENGKNKIEENSLVIDKLEHSLTAHPAVDATCKIAGNSEYWSCGTCGKYFSDAAGNTEIAVDSWIIPATDHTMTATVAKTASCTVTGNIAYWTCSKCGKNFNDAEGKNEIDAGSWIIPKTAHNLTETGANPASCTEAGNSAYWTCGTCGKYFSDAAGNAEIADDSWIIPATNHNWSEWIQTKAPTCIEKGETKRTCLHCGENETEEISVTDHIMTATAAKNASCTETGNIAYWTCSKCGKHFNDAEGKNVINADSWVIPMVAHNLIETGANPASCTEAGNSAYWTCETCGKYFGDAAGNTEITANSWVINKLGHNLNSHQAVAETCTTAGNSAYWTCETCGKHFSDAAGNTEIAADSWIISAAKHNLSEIVAKEATCTEAGNNAYWYCDKCNKYYSDAKGTTVIDPNSRVVSATGHIMSGITAKEATCTEAGNKAYWICSKCNKYFSDKNGETEIVENSWILSATGHTMIPTAAKAATCTETGNSAYWYCSTCSNYYSDADGKTGINENLWIIPMTGHNLSETTAKEATCTEAGNSTYWTCETCGKHFSDSDGENEMDADSWVIPMVAHNLTETVANPASCTEAGNSTYWTCETCGKHFSDAAGNTEISAGSWVLSTTGHTLTETAAKTASCTEAGNIAYWTCCKCGKHFSDAEEKNEIDADSWGIPMVAHILTETVAKTASCTEAGNSAYWSCQNCDKFFNDAAGETEIREDSWVINALNHNMTAHTAINATCTTSGNSAYWFCERCEKYFSDEYGKNNIGKNSWIINKLGHSLTPYPAVAETCTTDGNSAYWFCEKCNKYFGDEDGETEIAEKSWILSATGHTMTPIASKAATCTEAGNIAYWTCNNCGKTFGDENGETEVNEESRIIAASGHKMTPTPAKSATCTESGNSAYWTCSNCGKTFSDANGEHEIAENSWISGNPLGHQMTEHPAVKATCETPGNSAYWSCDRCGRFFSDAVSEIAIEENSWVINASGHRMKETAAKEATCTTNGNIAYWSCETCGNYYEDAEGKKGINENLWIIPPTNHHLSETPAREATCTDAATCAYWTCDTCGKTFGNANGDTEIAENSWIVDNLLGHQMTEHPAVNATCKTPGNSAYWSCDRCSKFFSDADGKNEIGENSWVIGALGHKMTAHSAVDATCMTAGNSPYWSCDRCGKYFSDENRNSEIEKDSRILPAIGHDLTATPAKKATCADEGNIAYWTCKTCGKHFSDAIGKTEITAESRIITATGHNMMLTPAKSATCTQAGNSAYWFCNRCDKYFSDAQGTDAIDENSWIIGNPLGHHMTEHPAVKASCEMPGHSTYWSCDRCGEFFSDAAGENAIEENSWIINATGHSMKATAAKAETCTTDGNSAYWTCETCGNYYTDVDGKTGINENLWIIPMTGHHLSEIAAKEATCTKTGNSAYWTCETCGKHFSDAAGNTEIAADSWIISATKHNLSEIVAKEATCTEAGNNAYWFCDKCNKYYSDAKGTTIIDPNSRVVSATGHIVSEITAKEATCTEAGNKAYWICSKCNKYFSDENGETEIAENSWILSATGHTMTPTAAKAATCTETGNSAYWYCSSCGNYYSDADGRRGINENFWITPMTGHHLSETAAKEATCTEAGNSTYWTCETCGKHFIDANSKTEITMDSRIIPASGHNMTLTPARPATCTEDGNSAYWYCSTCGNYYSDADGKTGINENLWIIPMTGHHLSETTAKEATCTEAGNNTYWTCETCGKHFSDANGKTEITLDSRMIAASGHDMIPTLAKPATCTEDGNSAYWYCSTCGNYYSDADGKTEINENCWIIPMTDHHLSETLAKEATCTTAGNSAYWTCDICGNYFSDADGKTGINENFWIIPMTDHCLSETPAREATCTEAATCANWTCENCGKTFSDANGDTEISENSRIKGTPLGHRMTKHPSVNATCETPGNSAYWSCDRCGKFFSDAQGDTEIRVNSWIITADHIPASPVVENEIPATCTGGGSYEEVIFCSICSAELRRTPKTTEAAGHTPAAHAAVKATCTTAGSKAYWECNTCYKKFSDEACTVEIDDAVPESALGHHWEKTTYTWSKDYKQVTAERHCSRNAAHTQKETVGTDVEVTAEATYDAPGSAIYTTRPFANADFVQQTKTVEIPKLDRTTGTGTEQPGQPDPGQEPGNPPQDPEQEDQEPGNPPQDPGQKDQEPGNPPQDPEQPDQESGDPQPPESEHPQSQEPEQPQDPVSEQPQPEQTQPEQPMPEPESPQPQEQSPSEPPQTQPQPELPQTQPQEQPPQTEQQPEQEQPKTPTRVPTGSFTDPTTGRYIIGADGNATYKSPAEDKASVTVPDMINVSGFSVPVTKIDNNAFANSKQLETVTIGCNVKDIGSKAFSGCAKLKTVKGAANVEEIGKSAFASNKALKSLPKFPKLKKIGNNAFKGCTSLTKIIIGKSVVYIGKNAFNGCANLKTINIKSVRLTESNVKSGAFKGIFAKGTIKCPKSVIKEYKKFLPKKGVPKTVTIK